MTTLTTETLTDEQLRARQECGGDRYDEVWDGVYLMSPLADVEHQLIVGMLTAIVQAALDKGNPGTVYPGVNVSDREVDWNHNYRCPDVAVVLPGCPAKNCETHWCGGPDFLVEIVSPDDRSRQKFDFYAAICVRELLIIDRAPWALELYRLEGEELRSVGRSTAESRLQLQSTVLPLNFRLVPGDARPVIEVTHSDGRQNWRI
jgi:Uma2 family endonuclease